jgi:hypothetical protein
MQQLEIFDLQDGSGNREKVSFTAVTPTGERHGLSVRTEDLGKLIYYLIGLADTMAANFGPLGTSAVMQAIPLLHAKVLATDAENDSMGAILLDFGMARFALLQSPSELRELAKYALEVAARIDQRPRAN